MSNGTVVKVTIDNPRGNEWRARYSIPRKIWNPISDQGPQRVSRTFKTKTAAQEWAKSEGSAFYEGIWTTHPNARAAKRAQSDITVEQWLDTFHDNLATSVKATTLQTYRQNVRTRITAPVGDGEGNPKITRLASMRLISVAKSDIYEWWDETTKTYPDMAETNSKAYKRLRAAFSEAVRREMIPTNPVDISAASRKPSKGETYLPETSELHTIVNAMDGRFKALTSLMLFHGLRIGEALAVRQEDVKVHTTGDGHTSITVHVRKGAKRLTVNKSRMIVGTLKTDSGRREVPIFDHQVQIFLDHLQGHAPRTFTEIETEDGQVQKVKLFTTTTENRLMFDTSYRSILDRVKKATDVHEDIDPHSGRRWLITRLAEEGAHVKEIGRLLGQKDTRTILEVYMKVQAGRTTSLMERVNASSR